MALVATNVSGMLPCLVTHHTHKARTMVVKTQELREGLVKDGCPAELLGDLDAMEFYAEALLETLEGYKAAQVDAIASTRQASRAKREAEQVARQAARLASKTTVTPTVTKDLPAINITTGPEGVTVSTS